MQKSVTPKRLEQRLIDATALREAVINAIVHNDYSNGAPPKFEFFSDRMEITSMGGLPFGVTKDDFFSGLSSPRNKEIMRVFRDVELVEHLGSGIPRILERYSQDIFTLSDNYLRVTFLYHEDFDGSGKSSGNELGNELGNTRTAIMKLMQDNPKVSSTYLSKSLNISITAIEKNIKFLRKNGYIKRIGGTRGHWEVVE